MTISIIPFMAPHPSCTDSARFAGASRGGLGVNVSNVNLPGIPHKISFVLLIMGVILFSAAPSPAKEGSILFPLSQNDGFAATFCEYRYGHIHAGCDMRTFRRTGIPVIAPCDGSVTALHGDENGYGFMLTMTGDDGRTYRFAHLSAFESEKLGLAAVADEERKRSGSRFPFDAAIPAGKVRVKKGQVIAFSGDTGIGTPHLHFEASEKDGTEINPLSLIPSGDSPDPTAATISSFVLIPIDDKSTVEGLPVPGAFSFKNVEGVLSASINAVGKVVLEVRSYDENLSQPENTSRLGVYRIEVASGGKLIYGLRFDWFHENISRKPEYIFDPLRSQVTSGNFYYRLFCLAEKASRPAFVEEAGNGVIEVPAGGTVKLEVDTYDHSSNLTRAYITLNGIATSSVEISRGEGPKTKVTRKKVASGGRKKSKKNTGPNDFEGKAPAAKTSAGGGTTPPAGNASPAAAPGEPDIRLEYTICGILTTVGGVSSRDSVLMHYDCEGAGRRTLQPFNYSGKRAFFRGYDDAVKYPEFYMEVRDDKGSRKYMGGYRLRIVRAQAGSEVRFSDSSPFSFVVGGHVDSSLPLYSGAPVPERMNAASDAPDRAAFCFSQVVTSGKIYYRSKSVAGEGVYSVAPSGKLSFLDNCSETAGGRNFIFAPVRYIKNIAVTASRDEAPPSLKISPRSLARLSKPFKYSKKPESDFVTFRIFDPGSGIPRSAIKYFLDGAPCGNFELFGGVTLNCYLYDFQAGALEPGDHSIKLVVSDRAGNSSSYEKKFRVVSAKK